MTSFTVTIFEHYSGVANLYLSKEGTYDEAYEHQEPGSYIIGVRPDSGMNKLMKKLHSVAND